MKTFGRQSAQERFHVENPDHSRPARFGRRTLAELYWLEDQRDAVLVAQDDWSRPVREEWLYKLENELLAHPDAVLVGHSLGSILVA
jgi:hypothetical protein